MSREVVAEVIALIELGMIAPEDIVKCLRKANSEPAQPAPVASPHEQEPAAWLTEEKYAEMHTSKWTPKIQQVFSKNGILESQTIQYAPQSKPVSYPPAQRTWIGLTNKDVYACEPKTDWYDSVAFAQAIEARLKELNT